MVPNSRTRSQGRRGSGRLGVNGGGRGAGRSSASSSAADSQSDNTVNMDLRDPEADDGGSDNHLATIQEEADEEVAQEEEAARARRADLLRSLSEEEQAAYSKGEQVLIALNQQLVKEMVSCNSNLSALHNSLQSLAEVLKSSKSGPIQQLDEKLLRGLLRPILREHMRRLSFYPHPDLFDSVVVEAVKAANVAQLRREQMNNYLYYRQIAIDVARVSVRTEAVKAIKSQIREAYIGTPIVKDGNIEVDVAYSYVDGSISGGTGYRGTASEPYRQRPFRRLLLYVHPRPRSALTAHQAQSTSTLAAVQQISQSPSPSPAQGHSQNHGQEQNHANAHANVQQNALDSIEQPITHIYAAEIALIELVVRSEFSGYKSLDQYSDNLKADYDALLDDIAIRNSTQVIPKSI